MINYISQLYFLHVWSHLTLRDQKSWSILYILVIFPVRNVDILLLDNEILQDYLPKKSLLAIFDDLKSFSSVAVLHPPPGLSALPHLKTQLDTTGEEEEINCVFVHVM